MYDRFENILRRHMKMCGTKSRATKAPVFGTGALTLLGREERDILVFWYLTGLRAKSLQGLTPEDISFIRTENLIKLRIRSLKNQGAHETDEHQFISVGCNCKGNDTDFCPIHGFQIPKFPIQRGTLRKIVTKVGLTLHSPRRALAVAIRVRASRDEAFRLWLTGTMANEIFLWSRKSKMFPSYCIDYLDWTEIDFIEFKGALCRKYYYPVEDSEGEWSESESEPDSNGAELHRLSFVDDLQPTVKGDPGKDVVARPLLPIQTNYAPSKKGRPKKALDSLAVKPSPMKRGRPKKLLDPLGTKPPPMKRGRPKKGLVPACILEGTKLAHRLAKDKRDSLKGLSREQIKQVVKKKKLVDFDGPEILYNKKGRTELSIKDLYSSSEDEVRYDPSSSSSNTDPNRTL